MLCLNTVLDPIMYGVYGRNLKKVWRVILLLQVAIKQTTELSVAPEQNKYNSTGLEPDGGTPATGELCLIQMTMS